jgi:Holliday junction resolvasome RuvABC endonuclease subunit
MRILVLDQSLDVTGWTVVDESETEFIYPGFPGKLIAHGIITLPKDMGTMDKLLIFHRDLRELMTVYKPQEMSLENTSHVRRNQETTDALGALLVCCREVCKQFGIPRPYLQNPSTIKHRLTGNGAAEKSEIIDTVCKFFGFQKSQIKDHNHADSLGAAFVFLIRAHEIREARKLKKQRKKRK